MTANANPPGADTPGSRIPEILHRFADGDPGRSVAFAPMAADWRIEHVNGGICRPVASVIKIPVVMALYDMVAEGKASLDQTVEVKSLGQTRYSSILKAFDSEHHLTLRELAALALITSDNPLAVHLTTTVGFENINRTISMCGAGPEARMVAGFKEAELGAPNRANVMTATDVLMVLRTLAKHERYRPIVDALSNNLRNNRLPALLPEDAVVPHKTGSLEGVVNDAGIVRHGPVEFAVAFLCDGQDDPLATSNDIARCTLALYECAAGRPAGSS